MKNAGKTRKPSEKQLLVGALLKDTKSCNWALEMKMLMQLLKRIPDTKFWFAFGSQRKYPTLINLLSDCTTTNIVSRAFAEYTKNEVQLEKTQNPVELQQEKVGEDIIVEQQKPKTLKDFLTS